MISHKLGEKGRGKGEGEKENLEQAPCPQLMAGSHDAEDHDLSQN